LLVRWINKKHSCLSGKNGLQTARHHHGLPGSVHEGRVGVATLDHLAGTVFAASALGGNAQIYLDIFKALPFTGVLVNFLVRDAMADANDHGGGRGEALISDDILNGNLSHLHSL
jgi:hypothetical protein